jgi:hypothetical protein
MITPQALIQLKAFARLDGFVLAVVWLVSMWLYIKVPGSIFGPLLMLSTPFFLMWRLCSFRDKALDGHISTRRSIAYSCYTMFYASLIFAVGQYVYFRYLDNGDFLKLLNAGKEIINSNSQTFGMTAGDVDLAVQTVSLMSPVELVFSFMMNNLVIGAVLSPAVALLSKMTEKRNR